jgi:outer membrane protein assembly factor BamB
MIRKTMASLGLLITASLSLAADWETARGNAARTGCIDGQAGPASPRVLWVHRAAEHFIASPVPAHQRLHVSGLGAFNVASFAAFPLNGSGTPAAAWSRSTPFLKLAVVSAPAAPPGRLIFGDGMHQDSGGTLYCLRADGRPIWQLRVPGTLVHLEGSPTVAGGRVYIGGGNAGIFCVELNRTTLDGKELDTDAVQQLLDAKWKELHTKYEADKKKDPDFAVPPNEDQLPKPAPVKVWQQGADKWHVDAPVNVVGDLVLVTSSFLELEKTGDRAIFCLDAKTGNVRWRQALVFNPWGGASVLGNTVVVAGCTINYSPNQVKGAKGDLAAFDLKTGKPLWRKDVPGGILGSVALADGMAIACCTDGKVRAFDLTSGERRWIYDAKYALFAPAAVADGVVYAGDLRGVVHAVNATNGTPRWTLDLGSDPAVKAPGMIYGGPVLHGGKLYVATCNLDGPFARKPTVIVCIGSK